MVCVLSGLNSTMAGLHSIHLSMTHTCGTLCGRLCDRRSHYRTVCTSFAGILGLVAVVRNFSVSFHGAYQVVGSTPVSLAKNLAIQIVAAFISLFFVLWYACLPKCKYVYHMLIWCLGRPEVRARLPGTVIMSCDLPQACGEPNPGPLGFDKYS